MAQETNTESNRRSAIPNSGQIMKSSLIVSLLLHIFILLGLQKAFPIEWITRPLRTYHVELLRPPVSPLDNEKGTAMEMEKKQPEKKILPEETEDTITLDTKDKRYTSYAKLIKARLMQHWEYPQAAWENLLEGEVLVRFSLNRKGRLKEMKILQNSQYDILDGETARAIRAAAPFPPFPGSVTVTKLNIKASFAYRLTASK